MPTVAKLLDQVMQQQRAWLLGGDGTATLHTPESLQLTQGLLTMLVWAAKYSHTGLCQQIASCVANELPPTPHFELSIIPAAKV